MGQNSDKSVFTQLIIVNIYSVSCHFITVSGSRKGSCMLFLKVWRGTKSYADWSFRIHANLNCFVLKNESL